MKFSEETFSSPTINLIPILDCIFVLIFVFMIMLLNASRKEGLNLDLPFAKNTSLIQDTEEVLTIEIIREQQEQIGPDGQTISSASRGGFRLFNRQLSLRELDRELEIISLEVHPQSIIIKGDRDTPLSQTIQVLDVIKKYGFSNVTIETTKKN